MSKIEELEAKMKELQKEIDDLKKKKTVRWRAEKGGKYYIIDVDFGNGIGVCSEDDYIIDNRRYNMGNYFKTQEEAELVKEKILIYNELKDLALELNNGEEIDWTDDCEGKYYIYYDNYFKELKSVGIYITKVFFNIYCLNKNFLEIAKERIGEERLKKLFMEG